MTLLTPTLRLLERKYYVHNARSVNQITFNKISERKLKKIRILFFPLFCITEWNQQSTLTTKSENVKNFQSLSIKYIELKSKDVIFY